MIKAINLTDQLINESESEIWLIYDEIRNTKYDDKHWQMLGELTGGCQCLPTFNTHFAQFSRDVLDFAIVSMKYFTYYSNSGVDGWSKTSILVKNRHICSKFLLLPHAGSDLLRIQLTSQIDLTSDPSRPSFCCSHVKAWREIKHRTNGTCLGTRPRAKWPCYNGNVARWPRFCLSYYISDKHW